ncbi:PEP-CTERM sorting domain-containing protein [Nostoc sp. CMAA1605]|uniref:PEP-CTERM sorting domain-containing protein n=1 Tax=Nostoc sp. CMAA1605 TaxID=2055159 RepID=UPI001F15B469|nr:PEP-CTERM sorting domain-containing protein [Nostoc sp. CMAA1605]
MATANLMKKFSIATAGVTFLALATLGTGKAEAAVIVLDFEGIVDSTPVGSFYDTAPHDFDVTFSSNAEALVDSDAGGRGDFGGEPSPNTVLFFLGGTAATLNAPKGFTDGFSFFYSAIKNPGFVRVYDGLNATGNLLTHINLPLTPRNGQPDPTGLYSPFVPIGVSFSGIAKSVDFGGTINQIGFDDITFGSDVPGGIGSQSTPEPASLLGLLGIGAFASSAVFKRKQQKDKITPKAS